MAFIASRIAERFEGLPRGVSVDEEDNDDDDDDDVHGDASVNVKNDGACN